MFTEPLPQQPTDHRKSNATPQALESGFIARIQARRDNGYWQQPSSISNRDKLAVRELAERCQVPLPHLYWQGDDPGNIPFDSLPPQVVIKGTNGANGEHVLVLHEGVDLLGKQVRGSEEVVDFLNAVRRPGEQFLAEELVMAGPQVEIPPDYKVHMFGDVVGGIQVIDRNSETGCNRFYTEDWNEFPFPVKTWEYGDLRERPVELDTLLECARRLSREFPGYIRLDFYLSDRGFVLGETCGTPAGGAGFTKEADRYFGDLWERTLGDQI